ncbi:MAG: DUF3572 domain-containing protein [Rhodospirillaceae bacterium]|jgi:hypothetical protein|nr:DUF3572 domain-containing protein [Rhodospirillaceae bacterium]MBT4044694.1 DUF3572 domain-containing protein [Rhodospirillaceae bacterium]MBT4690366.1 DUF3572 domain-containing protein [Rhodospirillaceae bacterium]MBT5084011.1 DUF3572 domain-containing protein [Rhodospirillaceae bacterium]MBT5523921.1 DUF3572 domain-containing protein [Rhodospirillaceae bacterium]
MNEEQAKIVALQALAYLVGDEDTLQRFMDLSGMDGADLRARADDPAMLAGVLDFFLGNEAQLLEMCAATQMAGEDPGLARHALLGNKYDEWS